MAKTFKFKKEEIVKAGLELVREHGVKGLTARAIGNKLGSSSKVIFGLFKNMDELQGEVMKDAFALFNQYCQDTIASAKYPIYKSIGMSYILFAKNEPNLFQWLFMRDRSKETNIENDDMMQIYEMLSKMLNISIERAKLVHLEMWICVHGIATMLATSYLDLDNELISDILTDNFEGIKSIIKEK